MYPDVKKLAPKFLSYAEVVDKKISEAIGGKITNIEDKILAKIVRKLVEKWPEEIKE